MALPTRESRTRLTILSIVVFLIMIVLFIRIGFVQIVQGEELKKQALEQWTKGITIVPQRGTIYDRNGVKLAVSIKRDTVWVKTKDIKELKKADKEKLITILSENLGMEEEKVSEKINSKEPLLKVKQWIEKDQSKKLKEELEKSNLQGIEIHEDSRRYYPKGKLASYIIGHTNMDQIGQYGVESIYNEELAGERGKVVKLTDANMLELPETEGKIYEGKEAKGVKLTIDSNIQEIVSNAIVSADKSLNAKNVSVIVLDPKTGEILAADSKPGYDLNNPTSIPENFTEGEWDKKPDLEKQEIWYENWRSYNINDIYEPGSTFKALVVAAALEESAATSNTYYT